MNTALCLPDIQYFFVSPFYDHPRLYCTGLSVTSATAHSMQSSAFLRTFLSGSLNVLSFTGAFSLANVEAILNKFFPADKHRFIPLNVRAIQAGAEAVAGF